MSTYQNRMEQAGSAGARLVTPRSGAYVEVDGQKIGRGTAFRADHPAVAANRHAFMLAGPGCRAHASVAAAVKKEPEKKPEKKSDE